MLQLPNDPNFAPVIPEEQPRDFADNGSIYRPARLGGVSLYDDIKAHQVGDVITVVLDEHTDSKKNIKSTYTKKSTDETKPEPTFFGDVSAKWRFPKQLPIPLTSLENLGLAANISADRKFEGSGTSLQNNQLTGTITVTVAKIYSNGNLFVRGEKWVGINEGDEYIRLSGIVRREDVAPNNTVLSSRIADSRIIYSGKGGFSNSSKPGWLTQILNSPWWPI